MEGKKKKNRRFTKAVLILLLLTVAILAVALAVRSREEGGLKALWRDIRGDRVTDEFFFENASGGDASDMDLRLAVAADSGLYVFDESGELAFNRLYSWSSPALTVRGNYGAVYDIGGTTVIFFTGDKIITEVTAEQPVISVTVNDLGYMCVSTEAEDYRGAVTVYNSLGTAIYRWSAGVDRILSARVSGRDSLLTLEVGRGGSRMVLLSLDSTDVQAEYEYPGLLIDACFTDSGITAVATDKALGFSSKLEERWSVDYSGRFLECYSMSASTLALGLTDYRVGGGRTVETYSASGEQKGVLALASPPTDMDVSGAAVAVLASDTVTLYTDALEESASYDCSFGAEHVSIRSDGSVLCSGTFSAYVYGAKS